MSPTILITAGSTRNQLDPVRFIGNRSSGHLGCQLALAAVTSGFETTLLLSKSSENPTCHPRLQTHRFSSTRDLESLLHQHWPSHTLLIMAAAVGDFTPKGGPLDKKQPRGDSKTIELVPTQDLVAAAAKTARDDQRIIAFALGESDTLADMAKEKLQRKRVDAIVANPLHTMDAKAITATIYCKDGNTFSPPTNCSKTAFAHWLVEHLDAICSTSLSS